MKGRSNRVDQRSGSSYISSGGAAASVESRLKWIHKPTADGSQGFDVRSRGVRMAARQCYRKKYRGTIERSASNRYTYSEGGGANVGRARPPESAGR
jgi:hypothetical protein